MNENRFPELIRELYGVVAELEEMFPGRRFTPDGHMVGSLAECYAQHHYGLTLHPNSNQGHDAVCQLGQVEIKATQGNKTIALRSCPERLLVFQIAKDGTFEEVFNGPGAVVWALVEGRTRPSNGQYQISLSKLRTLARETREEDRLPQNQ